MGYLRILGYGILCTIAIVLLIVMCAILKESVTTHGAGQHDQAEGAVTHGASQHDQAAGAVIRSSQPVTVARVSASQ
ncbi:hypothetical protein FAZ69_30710 [Trinickia terrae]|uniref:Sperm-specific protein Phi-1 n=1 Tax=Trinickia terrae TaxID=2571161 RepID=A0A4U1HE91_9BURK|nr:hypothetical protein [Trinickia terrae]TKC79232.1 hypothetical protein FAZ69_30710 [Trinickia terrae]